MALWTVARSASENARPRPPPSREWDATLMCTRYETLRRARESYSVTGADLVVWLEGWAHTVCDLRGGSAYMHWDLDLNIHYAKSPQRRAPFKENETI